ncbi:tRNA-guanine transglycosylase, partial [bacterium]|nr:tRNA-guanine transglycosylase [bacterium]
PTRLARHQAAMTRTGRINLMNAIHAHDPRPIDESCACYTCSHFSRAYLRHLIVAKEMLAATLVSIHNIQTLVMLVKDAREAIINGQFDDFADSFLSHYTPQGQTA